MIKQKHGKIIKKYLLLISIIIKEKFDLGFIINLYISKIDNLIFNFLIMEL